MAWHSAAQHSTAQHSTAQHSTAQHSTAQHSTAQHSTAQHSIVQIGKGVALQDGGEDKVTKSVGSQVEQVDTLLLSYAFALLLRSMC